MDSEEIAVISVVFDIHKFFLKRPRNHVADA